MISYRTPLPRDQIDDSSRKRKWDEVVVVEQEEEEEEEEEADFMEKKRPGSMKRGSSLQSGEDADLYDSRTNKMTCKVDSDKDWPGRRPVSLNLELNLQPYEEEEKEDEMVAAVCLRCHMLVMLCVSRPCCPNCKFLHPKPDQILFKPPPPPKCCPTPLL